MENVLEAELTLSSSSLERGLLEPLVDRVASEALQRSLGARGTGSLSSWAVNGDRITLTLESEGGRPHQALLAMVRRLSEELGRSQKIGVRAVRALRYRVRFAAGGAPQKPISLPLPHTLAFEGETATLEFTDLPEEALRDNWVDRAVQLVVEKVKRQGYAGKEQYWSLLHPASRKEHVGTHDPTEEMLKRSWVRNGPTKGKWFLGPTAAHLFRTMERIARREVLEPLGFWEVVQPHLDSFEILQKTGHLEGLPGEFYYAAEPTTRDPAQWETFTDLVKITHRVPMEELKRLVGPPSSVLCYAQCPTIYWWLSGRTLSADSLPLKIYDRTAVSNRYESGGRHGLERVDEFHRLEPVYLGTPEQLLALREALLKRYAHVFDTVLDLEWRTAWVTPFYLQQSGGVGVEDVKERVKGTIDYEAYLPYRGDREHSEWLEFQNLSIVGDKYTKAFTIRAQKGELWSGCSGIGLERWLTTFLAQKGFNPADWPSKFREYCGELPTDVEFL
ncbi:MAG: serine--tRNA ligase [Thermoplasmata archaeon]|nr:serine--tRNA ligase [Thermoplasmata archaeon]MCI4359193.1 serine--tRNA ligase [Thermoplasmata archaeon]